MARKRKSLPAQIVEMQFAAWETIWRRTALMAMGTCSKREYKRMTAEKLAAMQEAGLALVLGRGPAAVLSPFHRRATANSKRLRR